MKRLLKKVFGNSIDNYFIRHAHKQTAALPQGSTVFFFDIDNTIADTRGKRHLTGVNDFPAMVALVKESAKQGKVFFLTARNIITYRSTLRWLQQRGFNKNKFGLVFLTDPSKKIKVLENAIACGLNVVLYDDLCYNHENGEIKKYDAVIEEIKKLDLSYKGIEDFKHLQ